MILGPELSNAQYSANFQTNIISGVTSNWPGDYYVGNTSFADVLQIQDGGVLASMSAGFGVVGGMVGSSNNSVIVSGVGSVWSNASVDVGGSGPGNSLIISNGGQVIDGSASNVKFGGFIGSGSGSSNNTVVVTGAGSLWKNIGGLSDGAGGLTVGEGGAWNRLIISNGASVLGARGVIGTVSSNNVVRAVEGGIWQNSTLIVGRNGSSNSLVIAGGLVSATNLVVGVASATCDNLVELDAGSLVVTNAAANAVFEVRRGAFIMHGGVLQVDKLVITNSCAQFIHTGGIVIAGSVVLDPNAFRITSITQQGNDLLVTWMMGPGATNTLQVTSGDAGGNYATNGFTDIFIVTNNASAGTVTNYLDVGAATNGPTRYYRARLVP